LEIVYNPKDALNGRFGWTTFRLPALLAPCFNELTSWSMDFDLGTGERPVTTGEKLIALIISRHEIHLHQFVGLVLRKATEGSFERIGSINLAVLLPENYGRQPEPKLGNDYIASLPLKEVRII
jgi:hypothetical protein